MASSQDSGDAVSTRKTGKRPRKPNYTYEELQLLIHTVHHNYDLLYGEGHRKNDERRKEVWRRLVDTINGQGVVVRTKDELQHKYRDLRAEVKKKLGELQRRAGGAGAEPAAASMSLTLLEKLIATNITKVNRGFQELHSNLTDDVGPPTESVDKVEEEADTPGPEISEGVIKEEEFEESTTQDVPEEESRLFAPPSWFLDYDRVPIIGQDAQDASVDLSDSLLEKRAQPDGKPVDLSTDNTSREELRRGAPTTPASTSTPSDGELGRGWSHSQPNEHASWRLTLRRLYELEERRELRHQQNMQLQKQHVQLQQEILQQQKSILQTIQSCMQLQAEQQERHHQDLMSILRTQHASRGGSSPSGWANPPTHCTNDISPKIPLISSAPRRGTRRGQLNTASFVEETPTVPVTSPEESFETLQEISVLGRGRGRGRRSRGPTKGGKSKKP